MTPQELKNSILQLAIQGKLVEQRPDEGTAEELYKQIQAEKQALVKDGKIKKEKPLPEITEDEIPFEIPESWMWVRLGILIRVIGGVSYDKKDVTTSGYRILRGGNIQQMRVLLEEDDVFLPEQYRDDDKLIREGDILVVASTGSKAVIGKAGYVDHSIPNTMIGAFLRICRPYQLPVANYLRCLFDSDFYRKHIRELAQGTNINNVKESYITEFAIPLPPLAEQKRIVAKIEELLPLIDRYEAAWSRLEEFNKRFPGDMQKSLLQMAIQGKLVKQRPEEGTGEELYQQIQVEKQALIKSGKIKKDKPLPEITDDEKPFDIPESWKWCYVGELFSHNTGKAMNASAKKVDKSGSIRKFITTSNLYWNTFDFSAVKEMFFSDDELERCTIKKGDLLMNEGGAYFGRTAIWNFDYEICFQNHVHRLRPYKEIELMYFYHVFFFYRNINMMRSKGTAMPGLSSDTLHNMIIPLPPLAEQKRIVAKLEELLPLCERLK